MPSEIRAPESECHKLHILNENPEKKSEIQFAITIKAIHCKLQKLQMITVV